MAPITISEEAKRAANLKVLQRIDSHILDIVGSATHVILYEWSHATKSWEQQKYEGMKKVLDSWNHIPTAFISIVITCSFVFIGSLFIVKRSDVPRFSLFVMNRSSTENLVISITSSFESQIREQFIIVRLDKNSTKVQGLWFHDMKEIKPIAKTLDRIVKNVASSFDDDVKGGNKVKNVPQKLVNTEATASLLSVLNINQAGDKRAVKSEQGSAPTSVPSGKQQHSTDNQEGKQLLEDVELDKKSLQLTLMSLLQDERFLDLIHAQYLKVVKARKKE